MEFLIEFGKLLLITLGGGLVGGFLVTAAVMTGIWLAKKSRE